MSNLDDPRTLSNPSPAANGGPSEAAQQLVPTISFSRFDKKTSQSPQASRVDSPDALAGELARLQQPCMGDKDGLALWSPAIYRPGRRREAGKSAENIERYEVLVYDFDALTLTEAEGVQRRVAELGLFAIVYSTWNHSNTHPEKDARVRPMPRTTEVMRSEPRWWFRLVLIPNRAFSVDEHPTIYMRVGQQLAAGQGTIDAACKDLPRMFYVPAYPATMHGTPRECGGPFLFTIPGGPVQIDMANAVGGVALHGAGAGGGALPQLADIDSATSSKNLAEHVAELSNCPGGGKHFALLAASTAHARAAHESHEPREQAQPRLLKLLLGALSMNLHSQVKDWSHAEQLVVSALDQAYARPLALVLDERKSREWSTDGLARRFARTYRDRARFDPEQGWFMSEPREGWAATRKPTKLISDMTYEIEARLDVSTEDGQKQAAVLKKIRDTKLGAIATLAESMPEIRTKQGRGVRYDMSVPRGELIEDTIVLPCCRLREIAPHYSARVDGWLRALGGDKQELLLDWIACLPYVHESVPALYIYGANQVGKSALISACARLWESMKPAKAANVLRKFNGALLQTPLVGSNEGLPKDPQTRLPATTAFREIVEDRDHQIEKKGRELVEVHGCVRMIIAENGEARSLRAEGGYEPYDIAAIEDRIIAVRADESTPKLDRELGKAFAQTDEAAAHFIWLACNRPVTPGRMRCRSDAGDLVRKAATSQTSVLYEHIARALLEPAKQWTSTVFDFPDPGEPGVRVLDGHVLVNATQIASQWRLVGAFDRRPRTYTVNRDLALITTRSLPPTPKPGPLRSQTRREYKNLDMPRFLEWCSDNGFPLEDIKDATKHATTICVSLPPGSSPPALQPDLASIMHQLGQAPLTGAPSR